MEGITQGWSGEIWFSDLGIRLPAKEGVSLDAPENMRAEGLISNVVVPINYVAGLLYPKIKIPVYVTANWWTDSVLDGLMGLPNRQEVVVTVPGGWYGSPRTNPIGDLASIGGITFFNGSVAYQLSNCKGAMLDLTNRQGEFVGCMLELWGTNINPVSFTPSSVPFDQAAARSQQCSHDLLVNPLGWHITMVNQLSVNASIPVVPPVGRFSGAYVINASAFSADVAMVFQAHHAANQGNFIDYSPFTYRVKAPGGDLVNITVTNPLWSNRFSGSFTRPRQTWPLKVQAKGNASGLSPILFG